MKKERLHGLDVIRSLAIFLVFLIHMIALSGAGRAEVPDLKWGIVKFARFLALNCVPLFLLLTGFLQTNKKLSFKHYTGGIPLVFSYFSVSAIVALLYTLQFGAPGDRIDRLVLHVFDFTFGYAWYVEMYLGVFLLIPFLNILFDALEQRGQLILIGVLVFLTMMPSLVGNFQVAGIWFEIIPDFLENMYVIAYYFIGAYIAKHRPSPKKLWCVIVAIIVLLGETLAVWLWHDSEYAWHVCNEFNCLTHTVVSVCIFLFFYDLKLNCKAPNFVFGEISVCSFEMYLLSYLTDTYFYQYLPLSPWLVLIINFVVCYLCVRVLRLALVPAGKGLGILAEKLFLKILGGNTAKA